MLVSAATPTPVKVTYRFPPAPGVECGEDGKEFTAAGAIEDWLLRV